MMSLLVTTPSAFAGTEAAPEISDVVGDYSAGNLDITKAWVTVDGRDVVVKLKLRDLSVIDPILDGHYRYIYHVEFLVSGSSRIFADLTIHHVESSTRTGTNGVTTLGIGSAGVGNHVLVNGGDGRATAGTASLNPATATITFRLWYETGPSSLVKSQDIISDFRVNTGVGKTPIGLGQNPLLPTSIPADSAGPGNPYLVP